MKDLNFINELESWAETHYEISAAIEKKSKDENSEIHEVIRNNGMFAKHGLAFDLTRKFEKIHDGREWDGEWIDEIDKFIEENVK